MIHQVQVQIGNMGAFKPPHNISERDRTKKSIFLAGSIEQGKATKWQEEITPIFLNKGWNVFNPRRDEWDATWKQEFGNPQFYQQVTWELNALENSDEILMVIEPNTLSPISLLELGLFARSGKLIVICPEGFWRKGNVDVVCHYYNVKLFNSLNDYLKTI